MRGGDAAWPPRSVVVGDDGSPDSMVALHLSAEVAGLFGAQLTLVRAMPHLDEELRVGGAPESRVVDDVLEFAQGELEDHAAGVGDDVHTRTLLHISVDDPAQAVLETAAQSDVQAMIAVGCRGLGALQRVRFGSVSTTVLRGAHGPVLVAPHAAVAAQTPPAVHVVA